MTEYRCVNGHDRCDQMYPGPDCPYCELYFSDKEISVMRHALGLPNKMNQTYRNYFVTGEGSADYDTCEKLVSDGFMKVRKNVKHFGGDNIYYVTRKALWGVMEPGESLCSEDWGSE